LAISETVSVSQRRKLAAIMFSDVVGYTAIMGRDEGKGVKVIADHRERLRALLPRFNGRLVGEIGDGALSSFDSVIDAVECARELQSVLQEDPELRLRIGIHVGDVLFTDNTVLGDGVNVASRIHAHAPPGGICIPQRVYEEIRNKPEIQAKNLGEMRLKNVTDPIRLYLITPNVPAAHPARNIAGTKRRTLLAAIGALLLLSAMIYGVVKWKVLGRPLVEQQSAGTHAIRSIAVLPLDNFSGDPSQEYFADGMTDELTTDLASISALRVISRSSVMQYQGTHRPPAPEIARALNVDGLVEGSVIRIGDRVRITAQLIDAPADKHLWAKSFERTSRDVLALQDELAAAIAHEINVELTPQEQAHLNSARPINPQAHEAYLKGRYFLSNPSPENLPKALAQFERAIQLDPGFAQAYAGLSDAYTFAWVIDEGSFPPVIVMPKAQAAAKKALQLDNTLAEAHCSLANVLAFGFFDWKEAESEFRQAIALNPNYAFAHDQYAIILGQLGRFGEAITESMRAAELDPLSPEIHADWALVLAWQGNYQAAMEQARRGLDLDPTSYFAQYAVGYVDIQAGMISRAILELQKTTKIGSAYLGYAYAVSGDRSRAMGVLEELRQGSTRRYVSQVWPAIIYLGLGDRQRSLQGLEKAYEARDPWLGGLKVDRIYDPLRSDPRFIELLRKVGLDNTPSPAATAAYRPGL
jgi:adenylate cyclase